MELIKSKYFTLRELTASSTAQQRKLLNVPNDSQLKNLQALVTHVLDPLRALYGSPLYVNSAFRSIELNAAVGGAVNSQHTKGQAADITTGSLDGNRRLLGLILSHCAPNGAGLIFDQLIAERCDRLGRPAWLHISYSDKNRRQVIYTYQSRK